MSDGSPRRKPAVAAAVIAIAVSLGLGVAWAGGQGGATLFGWPTTMVCVSAAFAVQWLAFVPAFIAQTERFYDLTGSLTYLTVIGLALWSAGIGLHGALLAGAVCIWAVRLGTFLFKRVHADGGDGRFDEIKPSAPRFLVAWTLQGLWVSLTAAAALAGITSPAADPGPLAWIGLAVFGFGFAVEVPEAWQLMEAEDVPDGALEQPTGDLANIDPALLADFSRAIRQGEVEVFFRPNPLALGFTDNVSVRSTPGGLPELEEDVLASCDVLVMTLRNAYGREVDLGACEVREVAGKRSLYVEASGAVEGIHSIQYLIEGQRGTLLIVTATSATDSLEVVRAELDSMVGTLELQ